MTPIYVRVTHVRRCLLGGILIICCLYQLLKPSLHYTRQNCRDSNRCDTALGVGHVGGEFGLNATKPLYGITSDKAKKCRVVEIRTPKQGDFYCTRLTAPPNPHVCVYKNARDDTWVSAAIHRGSVWEADIVNLMTNLLSADRELGLLDIGANVGQYSMLAAGLGSQVVAVEALEIHIRMQQRAAVLNHFQNNLIIVHNVVSDEYRMVSLVAYRGNMGSTHVLQGAKDAETFYAAKQVPTILMDDLLEVIPFKKGIMKMDIEGHEAMAMAYSDKLFKSVYFPYVFMEWSGSRSSDKEKKMTEDMLRRMLERGYKAYKTGSNKVLDPENWKSWPFDIFWRHSSTAPSTTLWK